MGAVEVSPSREVDVPGPEVAAQPGGGEPAGPERGGGGAPSEMNGSPRFY